jgi:hypothetical protein
MSQRAREATLAVVLALTSLPAGAAAAAPLCQQIWCREAEALVQRWLGRPVNGNPEIIRPPAGIDPQMAVVPPNPAGSMRIIRPRGRSQQQ